ncbi:laminin subunit gamma-2 [Trichomycterus rosablanca]|uniref:laminin subunit gamma-2 n=1 Tax=Trichomycterus rosablanca TaxID=2290929 RepID=UPI002F35FB47
MSTGWVFLCAICLFYSVQATHRSTSCVCNGKALYCVRDSLGLRCENCQDNTEGRHCENCKEGYYHQSAGERCLPCYCNPLGSEGAGCDSQGQCMCKLGVHGARCDQCTDGSPLTPKGCEQSQERTCFCSGQSNTCSQARGYSVYKITSTFEQGTEGWLAQIDKSVNPSEVQFRWSPMRHALEVFSKDMLPVYLSAPAQYLGNHVLSYGQTLSFSLRLDRGVRYPSTSDVVLEGAGLKVSAALGNLRVVIPCGRTVTYTFKLDEQPSSKWKPQLSATEFQTLLSNLTAVKIRATFGEEGRGYLDGVTLVSARLGPGVPAVWVQKCHCPPGYEGLFCEHCTAGYRRLFPGRGAQGQCEPCDCRGGSCDPETGDCYSADETSGRQLCDAGYYSDPNKPGSCLKCPCALGYDCALIPGTSNVRCNCPVGSTGSQCQKCSNGFFGDPLGESGTERPCQRCQCNGHSDLNAAGSCDRSTGECLKCRNNTVGFNCEKCVDGFYHSKPTDVCQACNCDPNTAVSRSCSDQGQCKCKKGYEGKRCERSSCPSCFNPVKSQIEKYVKKLQELEALFKRMGSSGVTDLSGIEEAVSTAEEMVTSLENKANNLIDTEKTLHAQLVTIGNNQLKGEGKIQDVSKIVDTVVQQGQLGQRKVADIQKLISDIRQNLNTAKQELSTVELPLGDAEIGTNSISDLVQKANDLAKKHTEEAGTVDRTAKGALSEAEKASALMRSVISGENKVQELVNDLKSMFEKDVALVDGMGKQAVRLSDAAEAESKTALDALKQITDLEKTLPKAPKKDVDGLVSKLDELKDLLAGNVTGFMELQKQTQADQKEAQDLMNQIKAAQKTQDKLLDRANAAKSDADQAIKLFGNLGSLDQTLEKLRGFEDQINTGKALADGALKKLPIIGATIQKAVADNGKTQDILGQLGDYNDAVNTLDKLNGSLAKIEKMSGSLPPSSDLLKAATTLKGGLEGLKNQANSAMDKVTKEKNIAEKERQLAEEVNHAAEKAYSNANHTRDAVRDTLQTVTDLLGLLDKPAAVDDKKVSELENAILQSRRRVETELRPRLQELEDKEAQQRAAIANMINDINTILVDIENLEHINRTIPNGCYNTAPIERP